jgi:hypothetical protein
MSKIGVCFYHCGENIGVAIDCKKEKFLNVATQTYPVRDKMLVERTKIAKYLCPVR